MADPYQQAKEQDLYEPYNRAVGFADRFKSLFGQQQSDIGGYLDRFRGAIAGQENLPHMFDRLGRELNIPNLRQAATSAQNTLTNLPYAMSSASRGFDVSDSQATRATAQKMSALAPLVQTTANSLNSAYDEMGRRIGYTQQEQAKQLQPYEKEQQFLTDRFARETTGYTFGMQSELQSLLQKMQTGAQLTEGERTRANQMAIAKLQYDAQMAQIASNEKMQDKSLKANPWGI